MHINLNGKQRSYDYLSIHSTQNTISGEYDNHRDITLTYVWFQYQETETYPIYRLKNNLLHFLPCKLTQDLAWQAVFFPFAPPFHQDEC